MRRVTFLLPWLAVVAALAVLSTAALSLAGSSPPAAEPETVEAVSLPPEQPLIVPDVRLQPYVFAKGMLEDAGFAWRVKGKVKGFPANVVTSQKPAPGTLMRDTGAPTIVLTLERNTDYEQRGLAKNESPYKGTKNVRWDAPATEPAAAADSSADEKTEAAPEDAKDSADPAGRPPAFVVPGAPPEPPEEIPLTERADNLAQRLAGKAHSDELEQHWLYQHEWIVTGAKFGWSNGEAALVKLIEIDEDLQSRWGMGALSAEVARNALDEVRAETAEAAQGP